MGVENDINRMIWEGSPVSNITDPRPKNSQFPERVGRIKRDLLPDVTSDPATRGMEEMDMAGHMVRVLVTSVR